MILSEKTLLIAPRDLPRPGRLPHRHAAFDRPHGRVAARRAMGDGIWEIEDRGQAKPAGDRNLKMADRFPNFHIQATIFQPFHSHEV